MAFRIVLSTILLTLFIHANSNFGSITTGSQAGTYIQIGNDISKLFDKYNAKLNVISSDGSLDNLNTLAGLNATKKASFAIVQNDALEYYRFLHFKDKKEDSDKKIKSVFPLYNEFIHVFTRKGKKIEFKRGGFLRVGLPSQRSGQL